MTDQIIIGVTIAASIGGAFWWGRDIGYSEGVRRATNLHLARYGVKIPPLPKWWPIARKS